MKKVFQIQIALKGVKPKVWRRVLVPSDVLLSDFHRIIQMSMGWTDTHLHQFYIKGWGYMDMLEVLKQPEHEEYKSYLWKMVMPFWSMCCFKLLFFRLL